MDQTILNHKSYNSRYIAANIVDKWLQTQNFPDRMIKADTPNRALVMEITYGAVRWKRLLEWIISRCANREPDNRVMSFLMIGLYQIFMMDNMEEYAAVNETVEAVKASSVKQASGFVNGILRHAIRKKELLKKSIANEKIAVRTSHPDILVERWIKQFGAEKTNKLCDWNNKRPDIVIRPNLTKINFHDFQSKLFGAGIKTTIHPFAVDECLILEHGLQIPKIPGFNEGMFTVQDPSTLHAVKLLNPQPGENIFDACAAPGGKLALIAEKMNYQGNITAMDLHNDRLDILKENVERLQLDSVRIVKGDATKEGDIKNVCPEAGFDRILLDLPCSNTGVLRRRADARWRFSKKRLRELMNLQENLLNNVSKYLKPDGLMVYSTCSLETDENEGHLNIWLKQHTDFEKIKDCCLYPFESGTDGIYACAVKRSS